MSGAYVAKPAAEVPVDYPDGWNPDWPFPGPFPPGFDPSSVDWPGEGEGEESSPDDPDEEDKASIVLFIEAPGYTTETGGTTRGGIFLRRISGAGNTAPIDVPIQLLSGSFEISVSPESVHFDAREVGIIKWFTLTGNPDDLDDGDFTESVVAGPSTSSSAKYAGLLSAILTVVNMDGETTELHKPVDRPLCTDGTGVCTGSFGCPTPEQLCASAGYPICENPYDTIPLSPLIDGVQLIEPESNVHSGHWYVYWTVSNLPETKHSVKTGIVDRFGYGTYTGDEIYLPNWRYGADGGGILKWCTCACLSHGGLPFFCCEEYAITTGTTVTTPPTGNTVTYYLRVYW